MTRGLDDAAYEFREMCRQQTRQHIQALEPGGSLRGGLEAMNGKAFVDDLLHRARMELVGQREPGTNIALLCARAVRRTNFLVDLLGVESVGCRYEHLRHVTRPTQSLRVQRR